MEYVSIWNRFTKGTETRKVCTTDWEVVPHIDYLTAKKVRMTELKHRCLLNVHCVPKTLTFLFLNNSVKNEPILTILGTRNPEGT